MGKLGTMGAPSGYHHRHILHLLHLRVSVFRALLDRIKADQVRCISARRRRQQGFQPYRGTGWLPGTAPPGHGPAQYTGGAQQHNNQQYSAPPVYSPSPNQTYYGPEGNQPYFRGQEQGVELQQPQSTYQPAVGGDPVYTAPAGPPPGKKGDGIIR